MKPKKQNQPERPHVNSVFGCKPYTDQVPYIDEIKLRGNVGPTEVARAMLDYFIRFYPAADFWRAVNGANTQTDAAVNLPKSVTPEVNVVAEIASPGETFAAAPLFLREIVDCGREQEASVVNVDTAPPVPVVNRTAVGLWAVAVLGVFCTLTFFAGRLTSPLILQSEASNRVNAQLREELKMAQGDATMARQEMTIAQKRAQGLETVMLKSWSSLPPTDQELLEMARRNQQVASARLAKINVNAPPEAGR
jgi:hypothetical protein